MSAYKRFDAVKTLPQAEFISAKEVKSRGPGPILIGLGITRTGEYLERCKG